MDRVKQKAIIEAVLFAMGESVEVGKLAELIDENKKETKKIVYEMIEEMVEQERGIGIIEVDDSFQMCSREEYYEYLIQIAKIPKKYSLSETLLETLSIIAYKQPVTRMDLEKVRGVNCDHAINRLVEYNFVKEVGRLDAPGRPLLFGTTEQFLRSFGVKSLDELPEINPVQIEEFKEQAIQEVQLKLDI